MESLNCEGQHLYEQEEETVRQEAEGWCQSRRVRHAVCRVKESTSSVPCSTWATFSTAPSGTWWVRTLLWFLMCSSQCEGALPVLLT